jgi:hypothetical protein
VSGTPPLEERSVSLDEHGYDGEPDGRGGRHGHDAGAHRVLPILLPGTAAEPAESIGLGRPMGLLLSTLDGVTVVLVWLEHPVHVLTSRYVPIR